MIFTKGMKVQPGERFWKVKGMVSPDKYFDGYMVTWNNFAITVKHLQDELGWSRVRSIQEIIDPEVEETKNGVMLNGTKIITTFKR